MEKSITSASREKERKEHEIYTDFVFNRRISILCNKGVAEKMRLIDFDKIPFLAIPIAPVVKGESVHYEQGALKEWFDGTQDVEAVTLDRIKELRGDVSVLREERRTIECHCGCASDVADEVLELIDKLIAEVEG